MCFVWISQQTATGALHNISRLVSYNRGGRVFTTRYALSPYIKLELLVFKRLTCLNNYFLEKMNLSPESRHLCLLRIDIRWHLCLLRILIRWHLRLLRIVIRWHLCLLRIVIRWHLCLLRIVIRWHLCLLRIDIRWHLCLLRILIR